MLDEHALRRPDYTPGAAIKLCDGQTWHFPHALIEYLPRLDSAGKVELCRGTSFGADYDALADALSEADDAGEQMTALMALAIDLLWRNYALSFEQTAKLLRYKIGESPEAEANRAMWAAISAVALGRSNDAPKPAAVG